MKLTIENIRAIQSQLTNALEDMGNTAMHLREATQDLQTNSVNAARLSVDDALECASNLEATFADISFKLSRMQIGGVA